MALPPIVLMPVSKASRVRRLAFSNMSTICLASSAWRYSRGLRLTSWPSLRMARTSALVRSAIEQRSSPDRRAAAERTSGSFWTETAASGLSIVALSDMVGSCCAHCRALGLGDSTRMFGEDFVEGTNRGVHVSALQNVGRQEAQNRITGAVDQDPA